VDNFQTTRHVIDYVKTYTRCTKEDDPKKCIKFRDKDTVYNYNTHRGETASMEVWAFPSPQLKGRDMTARLTSHQYCEDVRFTLVNMAGIVFNTDAEKVPDILTLGEIKQFLERGKELQNEWYPIWAMALLTGMRNGELYALEWSDVDFENSLIRVSKSYNSSLKIVKSTKAGYWRNIPISSQLRELLIGLKSKGLNQHVLPRLGCWNQG
jgi:integrase